MERKESSMSAIDDKQRAEECIEYRENMDTPMESLAMVMSSLGFTEEGMMDHQLIEVVSRKLKVLHALVLAGGMKPEMLKAIMGE
jgi:hypothetical protein